MCILDRIHLIETEHSISKRLTRNKLEFKLVSIRKKYRIDFWDATLR